jgi:peptide/nickel transport system permease protein
VVNLAGLSLPALIGGSVLIETIFCVPGMGRLMVESTFGRNYPVLMGLVMLYGTIVILANLLADVLNNVIDPRLQQ